MMTSTHSNVPKCSSAPCTPICHDTGMQAGSTRTCCSPAPTDPWHQQQEPTSELQSRPLWTSPLLHQPFPKAEDTDRANSFAPQHSQKSPAPPALGKAVSCGHFCPAPQPFPLLTQTKGATSQSQRRNDAGWEIAAAKPWEGRGPGQREPLWGVRGRN